MGLPRCRTPDEPCQGVLTEENGRGTFQLLNLKNGKNAMKTTIEIHDDLLARAEQYARKTGRPLYTIVEEGLRQVLPATPSSSPYRLPDLSEGKPGVTDPLKAYSWQELRGIIYGEAEKL